MAKVFTPGYFAREDTATPMKIAVFVMFANAALALALMLALRPHGIGHVGIALATSITGWLNAALLWRGLVRRGQFSLDARMRRRVWPILAAAAAMSVVLAAGEWGLAGWFAGPMHERTLALALLIGLGLAVYFGAAQLLGAVDLRELKATLRPRGAPRPEPGESGD
jgi:putative peptidoglycan lipid II flippase